jgi:hypothetical protein
MSSRAITTLSAATPNIRQVVATPRSINGTNSPWTIAFGSNVLAGSTIWAVGYWPNFASTYPTMKVFDTLNGGSITSTPYTQLDRIDDLTSLPAGVQGTQSMGHWYIANSLGGACTVELSPNPITVEDWVGLIAMEITGVATSSQDGHNISNQVHLAPGTNNITVSITNSNANSVLVALTITEADAQNPATPGVGTGFTDRGSYIDLVTSGNYSCRVESKQLNSTGSQSATFNAVEIASSGVNTSYLTVAAAFHP